MTRWPRHILEPKTEIKGGSIVYTQVTGGSRDHLEPKPGINGAQYSLWNKNLKRNLYYTLEPEIKIKGALYELNTCTGTKHKNKGRSIQVTGRVIDKLEPETNSASLESETSEIRPRYS